MCALCAFVTLCGAFCGPLCAFVALCALLWPFVRFLWPFVRSCALFVALCALLWLFVALCALCVALCALLCAFCGPLCAFVRFLWPFVCSKKSMAWPRLRWLKGRGARTRAKARTPTPLGCPSLEGYRHARFRLLQQILAARPMSSEPSTIWFTRGQLLVGTWYSCGEKSVKSFLSFPFLSSPPHGRGGRYHIIGFRV